MLDRRDFFFLEEKLTQQLGGQDEFKETERWSQDLEHSDDKVLSDGWYKKKLGG